MSCSVSTSGMQFLARPTVGSCSVPTVASTHEADCPERPRASAGVLAPRRRELRRGIQQCAVLRETSGLVMEVATVALAMMV